jgi:hypothetical protein
MNLFPAASVLFLIDYDGAQLVRDVLKSNCCQPCHRTEEVMAKLSIGCVHTPRQFGMQKGSNKQRHQAKIKTRGMK